MQTKEYYNAHPMAVDGVRQHRGSVIAGFLAATTGTITVTDADGTDLVDTVPLTAGAFTRIPLVFRSSAGGTVTLAGGASGTLFS